MLRRTTAVALALLGTTRAAHLERDEPAATTLTVTLKPGLRPALVADRAHGDQRWSILERCGTYYETTVAARYTLVTVCPHGDATRIQAFELSARDLTVLEGPCTFDQRPTVTTPVRFVDPAVQIRVGDEFAGVATDVRLPGRSARLAHARDHPLRIAVEHDVPTSASAVRCWPYFAQRARRPPASQVPSSSSKKGADCAKS